MNKTEKANLLSQKLKEYFDDKDNKINPVVNSFSKLILKYIKVDPSRLINAIDFFVANRNSGFSNDILSGKNSVNTTIDENGLLIKTFFHKEYPALYFFKEGENNAFFKLKKEKKDNKIYYKARIKIGKKESDSDFEEYKEDFVLSDDKTVFKGTCKKVSSPSNQDDSEAIKNLSLEEEDFLELLTFLLNKQNVEFNVNLSESSKDIIFGDLYKGIVEATSFSEELKTNELFRILSETLYQNYGISSVSKKIADRGENPFLFYANNGLPLDLLTNCGDEHLLISAKNSNGENVSKYNIFKTIDGFTIYRRYLGKVNDLDKHFSVLTINLSKNNLRVVVFGDKKNTVNPIEISTSFYEDGKVEYDCNENYILYGDQPSDEKHLESSQKI